jgi:AmmeMemoRadiSam system protein B
MRKKVLFAAIFTALAAVAAALSQTEPLARVEALFGLDKEPMAQQDANLPSSAILANGFEYKNEVESQLAKTPAKAETGFTQIGITSHHLPTAAGFIAEFYQTLKAAPGPRETFVIVGPDHFNACKAPSSVSTLALRTPFGQLEPDPEIINKLKEQGLEEDNGCFAGEHAIGVQAMYISKLFPRAKVVAIIVSGSTGSRTLENIKNVLFAYRDRMTLIVSVDFSHYQTFNKAQRLDSESAGQIQGLSGEGLDLEHMDSPQSINLGIGLAKELGLSRANVLGRANSYNFTGSAENTTGYLNVLSEKQ